MSDPEMGKVTSEMALKFDPAMASQLRNTIGIRESEQLQYATQRALEEKDKQEYEEASSYAARVIAASFTKGFDSIEHEKEILAASKISWKDRGLEMLGSISKNSFDEARATGNPASIVTMGITEARAKGLPVSDQLKIAIKLHNAMSDQQGRGPSTDANTVEKMVMYDYENQRQMKKTSLSYVEFLTANGPAYATAFFNVKKAVAGGTEGDLSAGDTDRMLDLLGGAGTLTPEMVAAIKGIAVDGEAAKKGAPVGPASPEEMSAAGRAIAMGSGQLSKNDPMFKEFETPQLPEPKEWKQAGEVSKKDAEWNSLSSTEQSGAMDMISGKVAPADIEDWDKWSMEDRLNYTRALASGDKDRAKSIKDGVTQAHSMGKDFFYSPTFNIVQKRGS
jgi:hypothetical protein